MQPVKQYHVSRTELARLLGTTPDMVSKYIAEGMPVLSTGNGRGIRTMLDLAEALPWILNRKSGSLDEARTRQANESADKLALENSVRRGELVEVETVARQFAECAAAVKARLRRIPDAVAARVLKAGGPAKVKALLLAEIDGALTELSQRSDEEKGAA